MKRFWIVVGLCFLIGCAAKPPRESVSSLKMESPQSSQVEPPARGLFFQAERAFYGKNYDLAIKHYQAIRTKFPGGKAAELATYRLGSIYYYRQEYPQAGQLFETFLKFYPKSDLAFDVTYNWAAAEYQLGHAERSEQILNRMREEDLRKQGNKRALIVYQLGALVASARGNHSDAVLAYSQVYQLSDDGRQRVNTEENIDAHLSKIDSPSELQALVEQAADAKTKSKIQQKLALASLGTPAPLSSVTVLDDGPDALSSASLSGSGSKGERGNIGVVLPLSGKMAPYGRRALEGILLAARAFEKSADGGFKIFVEDSGSSPVLAEKACEILVNQNGVVAILGPLNFKEALAVGDKAGELGVLNLSLSSKAGVSERNPFVFQNALTPRVQLENLVRYSVADKGYRRFAVMAPDNAFGRDMTGEFWQLVEAAGGRIVGYETYEPDEKDFQDEVKSLVGLSDPKSRRLEWTKLQEYIKEQKLKTGREPKVKLQPIVDFDAIFLPDSPRTVAAIAANLAFFDVNEVSLLGTTEWNSDQLYKRGGRFVEKAIFPGVMLPSTRSARQREFIRLFNNAYGNAPDLLVAQAFEAMMLVGIAASDANSGSRNDLVRGLSALRNVETPIGTTSFDENRLARRIIPVVTLDHSGNPVEQ